MYIGPLLASEWEITKEDMHVCCIEITITEASNQCDKTRGKQAYAYRQISLVPCTTDQRNPESHTMYSPVGCKMRSRCIARRINTGLLQSSTSLENRYAVTAGKAELDASLLKGPA